MGLLCSRETGHEKLAVRTVFRDLIDNGISLGKISVELRVLRGLKHDNLIEVIDHFDTDQLYCNVLPFYEVSAMPRRDRRLSRL